LATASVFFRGLVGFISSLPDKNWGLEKSSPALFNLLKDNTFSYYKTIPKHG